MSYLKPALVELTDYGIVVKIDGEVLRFTMPSEKVLSARQVDGLTDTLRALSRAVAGGSPQRCQPPAPRPSKGDRGPHGCLGRHP